jgi:hypothetical protein
MQQMVLAGSIPAYCDAGPARLEGNPFPGSEATGITSPGRIIAVTAMPESQMVTSDGRLRHARVADPDGLLSADAYDRVHVTRRAGARLSRVLRADGCIGMPGYGQAPRPYVLMHRIPFNPLRGTSCHAAYGVFLLRLDAARSRSCRAWGRRCPVRRGERVHRLRAGASARSRSCAPCGRRGARTAGRAVAASPWGELASPSS